ncbi:antitoxin VbhA family protein [Pseudomonas putida]
MTTRDLETRGAHVAHVMATNNLEGARTSAFFADKLAEYREGKISSAQLLAATKARYSAK